MTIRKIALLITFICAAFQTAYCQTEAMKDVINNLAFYNQKNDLKYLADAKKAVEASFKTHADSVDLDRNIYKAVVYASILYGDSLNKLKQPDTLLLQTTKLVNKLATNRKIYRYNTELNYAKGCIANVYLRKAFDYYGRNNYRLAIDNFNTAHRYVPAQKEVYAYLANLYYKLGGYKTASAYYDTVMAERKPRIEYVEAAANVFKTVGDTVKALQAVVKGLELYPGDKNLLVEQADIYNNKKEYTLLKPLTDELVLLFPNDADVIFMAANCNDHLNNWDKAAALYKKGIEINSTDFNPVFNLGMVYLKTALKYQNKPDYQARIDESELWLKKANEIDPNSRACLKTLQMLYLQTGENDQLEKIDNKLKQLTNY